MRVRRQAAPLLVLLVVAACSQGITSTAPSGSPAAPGGSVEASPSLTGAPVPSPTEGASALPSPTAAAPTPSLGPVAFDVIPPGSAIEVTVAELNLRRNPSTSAKRLEVLKRGQVLIVSPYDGVWFGAGPVTKNGFTWYPVMKLQNSDAEGNLRPLPQRPIFIGTEVEIGWVATDNGEASFVKAVPPRCPTTVDLENVAAMLAAERLACFEGPFVLEGTFGCPACGAEMTGDFDPIWLNYPQALSFLSADVPEQIGPVILRIPPDGPPDPANGAIIRATVHVNDPASAGCSIRVGDEAAVPAATAVLYCREQLVLDSYEVLGMDPDFNT